MKETYSSLVDQPDLVVSRTYILTVQRLIEKCLTLSMDRNSCVRALARHAGVKPVVTLTVWKELEQANPDFFLSYRTAAAFKFQCSLQDDPSPLPLSSAKKVCAELIQHRRAFQGKAACKWLFSPSPLAALSQPLPFPVRCRAAAPRWCPSKPLSLC
eukprot:TRINITY_DN311_c0_g1_i1.p1 TRINITY_DN311_c0_g1~~TRINITY_DN311_c0_g1_i1.p1  ORF type:complete len:184 (-),score=21.48 TRINITY_DN311_c0_g1_i1:683-1153(-)